MQAGDALYYPYIHFWDVGWLKSTALYWDSVSRIVPGTFEPKDSDEVKRLIDAGYVDPGRDPDRRRPDPDAVRHATQAIGRLFDAHGDELVARYGLEHRASWTETADSYVSSLRWVDLVPELDPGLDYLQEEKFGPSIRERMVELKLADPIPAGDWYGVHPRLGEAYLWALASQTARKRGQRLLADNPKHHTAIMGDDLENALRDFLLGPDEPGKVHPHLDTVMMTVVLRNVRPCDYMNLPVKEIVALRDGTDETRGELQRKLQKLVSDRKEYLQEIQDLDELERLFGDLYNRQLKPSLEKMETALQRRHRVEWKGALAASFVAPPSVIASLGHPAAWPLLFVCAGGALAVGLWRAQMSVTDVSGQDPVAFYLHQIKNMKEDDVIRAVATTAA